MVLQKQKRNNWKLFCISIVKAVEKSNVNDSKIPYKHSIELKDKVAVVRKPRVLSEAFHKDIYEKIDKLLDEGVMELSDSPYTSPSVPVVKKDKTVRPCLDYRLLNEKIKPKFYPIPHSEESLMDLQDTEVFTVLNLKSAYMHIPIKQYNQHKTAFVVPNATYQWTMVPFGLTDAAFSLAYVMNEILREFKFAKTFYDDCVLAGKRDNHLSQIAAVMEKFADFGIHVNLPKCQIILRRGIFHGTCSKYRWDTC